MSKFTKTRFQARLYAFCWTILETRHPDFDADKVKEQHHVLTILQALDFATEEEKKVIQQMPDVVNSKPEEQDQQSQILGALEGKNVVYKKMNPELLLQEIDLVGDEKKSGAASATSGSKSSAISCLVVLGIFLAIVAGIKIYNLPSNRDKRAYRAVEKASSIAEEREAVESYLFNFPDGEYIEDVEFRDVKLNADEDTDFYDYLHKYPNGEHFSEVKRLFESFVHKKIRGNGAQMTDIMTYLNNFPNGAHAEEVNKLCDSIWDSEIDKYHSRPKVKKTTKATVYFNEMLEYMKTNRINTMIMSTTSTIRLKDYSEYSQSVRDMLEEESFGILPIKGNVVSIRENFSASDQTSLVSILGEGLQSSLDSVFSPGFVSVRTSGSEYEEINGHKVYYPKVDFSYVIKSQEDVFLGVTYPHLWTYSTNNVPLKYLVGISITFNAKFTIPNSTVSYECSGKGHPEKDIYGIIDIRDGYRRMTTMSFARFADDMYSKLGLKEIYLGQ